MRKWKRHYFLKNYGFHSLQEVINALETYVTAFGLFILQEFHIKQEESLHH
jgi:hypothetical protein